MKIRGVPGFEQPLAQWALVALALAIVMLAGLVVRRDRAMQSAIVQLEHERDAAQKENDRAGAELARERSAREAFEISLGRERSAKMPAALALEPGLGPGGKPKQQLRIPKDVARVELMLPVAPPRMARYRAAISALAGGEEIWTHAALQSDVTGRRIVAAVPMEVIASGAYQLRLHGIDASGRPQLLGTFTFEVVRK